MITLWHQPASRADYETPRYEGISRSEGVAHAAPFSALAGLCEARLGQRERVSDGIAG